MSEFRILVTGSRNWPDKDIVYNVLNSYRAQHKHIVLVHGNCPAGADYLANMWAWVYDTDDTKIDVERHPTDWKNQGKKAGPIRNKEMVDLGADVCLAFIRNGSKGSTKTADLAEKANIPVRYFKMTTEYDV